MPQRRVDAGKRPEQRHVQELASSLSDAEFARDELDVSSSQMGSRPPPVPEAVVAEARRNSVGSSPGSPEVRDHGGARRSSRSPSPSSPTSPRRKAWQTPALDEAIGGPRSCHARVRSLEEMDEAVQFLRRKFRSRSYCDGGENPSSLFKNFDRNNTGGLNLQDFCRAARTVGHIRPSQMSDEELRNLFVHIDTNKPETLTQAEVALRDAKAELAAVKEHDVRTAEAFSHELVRIKQHYNEVYEQWEAEQARSAIDIDELTAFVWGDDLPSRKTSPAIQKPLVEQQRVRPPTDADSEDMDEYEKELTFTPRILERPRARKSKDHKSFFERQVQEKARTKQRLQEQKEQEFKAAHTFKPEVKMLSRSTLTPRGAASVVLADAHKEPTQIPLYQNGHNQASKVFDRLYTVSPANERHERLKKKQEHMTAAEALHHHEQQGWHTGNHDGGLQPIRHNPGGHQPGRKNKQAKIAQTRISTIKKKLRALSYTVDGQTPKELFRRIDSQRDGVLSPDEFKMALIKGAHAHDMSDEEQEQIFKLIDTDKDGCVSIDELTTFIWGSEKSIPKSTELDSPYEQLLPSSAKLVSPTPPRVYGLTRNDPEAVGLLPHARHKDQDETAPMSERSVRSLKRELRTRGLDSTGTKIELTKRLVENQEMSSVENRPLDRSKPKLAPGSMRSVVRSLMHGYMQGEVSARELASPAHVAKCRQEGLQTMLLELDVACVNLESNSSRTEAVRHALNSLFSYAEAALQRGEREHVEVLLPKLEAVAELLTGVENEQPAVAGEDVQPAIDNDNDLILKAKQKLRAMSYTSDGQNRQQLFNIFDRDGSGGLSCDEFQRAIRKVGHITATDMSEDEVGALFRAVDRSCSETIDVHELAEFVFGQIDDDTSLPQPPSKIKLRQLAVAVNKAKSDLEHAMTSLEAAELPETQETLKGVVTAHKKLYRQLRTQWEQGSAAAAAAASAAAAAKPEAIDVSSSNTSHSAQVGFAGSLIPRLSPHSARTSKSSLTPEPEPEPEPELEPELELQPELELDPQPQPQSDLDLRGIKSPELSVMAEQLNVDDRGLTWVDGSPSIASDLVDPGASIEDSLSGLWSVTGLCNGESETENILLLAKPEVVPGVFALHGCSVSGNCSPGGTLEPFSLRGSADLRGLLANGATGAPPAHASRIIFAQHYDEAGPDEQPTMWLSMPTVRVTAAQEGLEKGPERSMSLAMTKGVWSGAVAGTFQAVRDRALSETEHERLRARLEDVYVLGHNLSGLWSVTGLCDGEAETENFLLFAEPEVVPGVFALHGCSMSGASSSAGAPESFSLRGSADLRGLLAGEADEISAAHASIINFVQHYDEAGPDEQPTMWRATVQDKATQEDLQQSSTRCVLLEMSQGVWSEAVAGTFEAVRDRALSEAEQERLRTGTRRRV